MKQEIKDALAWLDKKEREHFAGIALLKGFAFDGKKYETPEEFKTIRRALLIADKLMQEPSNEMCVYGAAYDLGEQKNKNYEADILVSCLCFKAMRDQLLKEVDDDQDAH